MRVQRWLNVSFAALGLALTAAWQSATAQPSSADSVAREFIAALNTANWVGAAALADSESIAALREGEIASARGRRPDSAALVAQQLRHDPDMPRAVAEYRARRYDLFPPERFLYQNFEVCSVADLALLSPAEFAARWLQGLDHRESIRRILEWRGYDLGPEMRDSLPIGASRRVLGTITDRDNAYAVVTETFGQQGFASAKLLELRRSSRGWRVVLAHEMRGSVFAADVIDESGTSKAQPTRPVACPNVPRTRPPR